MHTPFHKSTIHSKQEVKAIQESFGGRMNEQNVIYMMKYNSALTRKEILSQATTWMNLEDIMNEISLSQKDKYSMIPPIRSV